MIENNKSLSNPIIKNINTPRLKLEKITNSANIKNDNQTPKLPAIKRFFPEISKTPLIDKNETNNTSNLLQKKYNFKLSDSLLNSPHLQKDYNSSRSLKLKKLNFSGLIKSPSAESIIPKRIPNIREFHRKIMSSNKLICDKKMNEEYEKFANQYKKNINIEEMLLGNNDKNKKIKTGIYGPNDNIVSVIRAKMERLKYDNEYRGVDPDLKELIKDEIMDAQVKLKRKP